MAVQGVDRREGGRKWHSPRSLARWVTFMLMPLAGRTYGSSPAVNVRVNRPDASATRRWWHALYSGSGASSSSKRLTLRIAVRARPVLLASAAGVRAYSTAVDMVVRTRDARDGPGVRGCLFSLLWISA